MTLLHQSPKVVRNARLSMQLKMSLLQRCRRVVKAVEAGEEAGGKLEELDSDLVLFKVVSRNAALSHTFAAVEHSALLANGDCEMVRSLPRYVPDPATARFVHLSQRDDQEGGNCFSPGGFAQDRERTAPELSP